MGDQKQMVRAGPHGILQQYYLVVGGARENCGKGMREGVSTAERTEEIEATSLTAAVACYVKPMLARVPSMGLGNEVVAVERDCGKCRKTLDQLIVAALEAKIATEYWKA